MANSSRFRRMLPVFIILFAAPIIVIFLFKFGKNKYKELPYYGPAVGFSPNGDTLRHALPFFSFTDQNNHPYGTDSLKGRICVSAFFSLENKDASKRLTENLEKIQARFRNDKDFRVVIYVLDPNVSSSAMNQFARDHKISGYQWQLLSGPADDMTKIIGDGGYLLRNSDFVKAQSAAPYSPDFVLTDKEGHIRGKYIGLDPDNTETVVEDAHTLFVYYANKNSGK